ncbi:CoA-binding protein [Marivita sp. GX14005]|uniref:CoA-binding protein n=1 Tax=Marivita sp. GX14005 TaxID=2942276 RepID=UPI0020185739|nr:CoA-binding protein [Marivita sp. GX14005]MCL3882299.1 CoA-binding protein [Marivita sp. GX14005]
MTNTDDQLRDILARTKTIALVGASMKPDRPSNYVGRYLLDKGYRVIPVNPGHAGEPLFGTEVVATLSEIDAPIDMVDIFRRSEAVPAIVDEALEAFPDLQTIWMQIGVRHPVAAAKAEARGVDVVMDRCPKVEIPRLMGR